MKSDKKKKSKKKHKTFGFYQDAVERSLKPLKDTKQKSYLRINST